MMAGKNYRRIQLAFLASGLAMAAGCVSTSPFNAVPDGSPPLAREGMHGILVMRAGAPFWKVYSYFHIPGDRGMARFFPLGTMR